MSLLVLLLGIASWLVPVLVDSFILEIIVPVLAIALGEKIRKEKSNLAISLGEILAGVVILRFIIVIVLSLFM